MPESAQQIAAKLVALQYEEPLPAVTQVDGPGFSALSAGIVTTSRAREIVQAPDEYRIYRFEKLEMMLASRRVDNAHIPFVIGVIAVNRKGVWTITAAFRLRFDDAGELSRVAACPELAFATFLERYGAEFNTGNGRALFVPVASFPPGSWTGNPADLFTLVGIDTSVPGAAHLHFKVPAAGEPLKLGWPFVVRTADYSSAER